MTQREGYFYASPTEICEAVAQAKSKFLADHPEYKVVESKLGAYLGRAVERRNEKGIVRPDGLKADSLAQAKYQKELVAVASYEARKCIERFRDEVLAAKRRADKDAKARDEGKLNHQSDFGGIPISW